MQSVSITGKERAKTGKTAANSFRREGLVPCVLYSKSENIQFNASPAELKSLVYTPDFKVADIDINGKNYRCILKELQFHPVTDQLIHIDFLKLEKGASIKIEVPLKLEGNAVGVKSGGKLTQRLRTLRIKTTPEAMVSELKLDISALDLGQNMRVRDIQVPNGVEIINAAATPIVSIEVTRALKSAAAETAAAEKKAGGAKAAPAKK